MTLALFSLVPGTGHPISDFDYPENSRKKTGPRMTRGLRTISFIRSAFRLFDLVDQNRNGFEQVADDAVIGDVEDRCFRVFVDRYDRPGVFHPNDMLDRTGNAERNVEFRGNGLPR